MENDKTEQVLTELAASKRNIPAIRRKEDGFSRMDVVNAFNNAFQMIGGVPRLALWANENPDKFYPLYTKLMPSTAVNISAEGNTIIIEHAIPATPLDVHPGQDGPRAD